MSVISHCCPALYDPDCLDIDASDNIYVGTGDQGLYRIASDGSSGLVTTTYMGNNFAVRIDDRGIFGATGTVHVGNARNSTDIAAVSPSGTSTRFLVESVLYTFAGLDFDNSAHLYAAELADGIVYRIDSNAQVSAFAHFTSPYAVAFHRPSNRLYVSDVASNVIYSVDLDGTYTVFAKEVKAFGLCFGPDGFLYVSDVAQVPHRIIRIRRDPSIMVNLTLQQDLSWNAETGLVYQIDMRTNLLSGSWTLYEGPLAAGQTDMVQSVSFMHPQNFYRVTIPDMPPF